MTNKPKIPKAFISYSWSSPEHEQWIIELATDLMESGVNVILDKWDLHEGADKFAFMEKMVTDPEVRKVVVICDRLYAVKADARKGGVGTETQIISKELYEQVDPTDQKQKFVAVISEKEDDGKPYVPTFLKSRIYIDMSDPESRTANFDQLLRWIHDKPLHVKPTLGKPPSYLIEEHRVDLGTGARYREALSSIHSNSEIAPAKCQDYFDTFSQNLELLRIELEKDKEWDDLIVDNLESFLPYRDEVINIFIAIAKYRPNEDIYKSIHSFFE